MAVGLLDIEIDAAKNNDPSQGGRIAPHAVEDGVPVQPSQMRTADCYPPGKFCEGTQFAIAHLEREPSLERRSLDRPCLAGQAGKVGCRRIDLLENGYIIGNDVATGTLGLEVQAHADAEWR